MKVQVLFTKNSEETLEASEDELLKIIRDYSNNYVVTGYSKNNSVLDLIKENNLGNSEYYQIVFSSKYSCDMFIELLGEVFDSKSYISNNIIYYKELDEFDNYKTSIIKPPARVKLIGCKQVIINDKIFSLEEDLLYSSYDILKRFLTIDPDIICGSIIKSLTINSNEVRLNLDTGLALFYREQQCCENIEVLDYEYDEKSVIGNKIVRVDVSYSDNGDTFYYIHTEKSEIYFRFGDSDDYSNYGTAISFSFTKEDSLC